jgi:serine/threonine protein phosphatase PrpC/predicted RNA-binding Zn-ribbon protein involved in translation (DUF1610 family)
MICVSCGAQLRPNARFCNQCGALQPTQQQTVDESPAPVDENDVVSSGGATSETAATEPKETGALTFEDGDSDTSSGRLKRPPRVLRSQDEADDNPATVSDMATASAGTGQQESEALPFVVSQEQESTSAPAEAANQEPAQAAATMDDLIDGEETKPTPVVRPGGQTAPATSATNEDDEDDDSTAWADAETLVETRAVSGQLGQPAQSTQSVQTATMDAATNESAADSALSFQEPPETATSASTPHGLPWPLPVSLIIGGRYRVESLVSAAPEDSDEENIYRVSDLKGYERCWSCGQEYGDEGAEASDRFCRECGADMLAREYLLYERRLAPDGSALAIDEANTAPEHPAVTGEMAANEERTFTQGDRSYRVVPRVTEPTPFPHGARILIGAATDVGLTRAGERNEDSLGALVLNLAHDSHMQPLALGIVADGLGGHVNGQDASRLAARMVTEQVLRKIALPLVGLPVDGVAIEEGLKDILLEGAQAANLALCNANDETGADMGSTLVAALLFGSSAYIINVGDSRGYLFADGELRRITTDHSFVEQLIASGFVKPEDRYTHPQRNQILRSLGDDPDLDIDLFEQKLKPGMRLMLCSDGLWEMVRDDESARILAEAANPQEACDRLIASANANGGEDNISVVVIEVRD